MKTDNGPGLLKSSCTKFKWRLEMLDYGVGLYTFGPVEKGSGRAQDCVMPLRFF